MPRTIKQEIFSSRDNALSTLAAAFPEAVKDGEVDWDALKAIFKDTPSTGTEKYELTWAGKAEARREAGRDAVGRTLRFCPEESKDAETTQNLYIEGDNLEVLKLLRENYYGAVKMIYIDPPYNTGNDFVYRDNFIQSEAESDIAEGNIDETGERLKINPKTNNRYHAVWLSMMYSRLRFAKDFLAQDGAIFISIDDNEIDNLRKLCGEIFGEFNFIAQFIWSAGRKNDSKLVSVSHEYIVCYAKSKEILLEKTGEWRQRKKGLDEIYAQYDKLRKRHKSDNATISSELKLWYSSLPANSDARRHRHYSAVDDRGIYFPADISWPGGGGPKYMVLHPVTGNPVTIPSRGWMFAKPERMQEVIKENLVHFGADETSVPCIKSYLRDREYEAPYSVFYQDGRSATKRLRVLLNGDFFDHPKDEMVLQSILEFATDKDSLVMDFFSGSGTFAHAVMLQNVADGGARKYICVQIPEKITDTASLKNGFNVISDIGKKRIQNAGEQLQDSSASDSSLFNTKPSHVDIGFKVFKTSDTVIRWTHDALHSGEQMTLDEAAMSDKDRLDFMPGFTDIDVVYEIALRQNDIPLSAPVRPVPEAGKRTYLFADSILVCLEESMTPKLVEALADIQPTPSKFVLRDSAFEDDIALKDETLRRLQALVARNTKDVKPTYVVDFI